MTTERPLDAPDPDDTGELPNPELVQLSLRRPTIGARVRERVGSRGPVLGPIADRVGRSVREGRIVCECEDVLAAEIGRAIEEGARSLAQIVARSGAGTGLCGGARCLDAIALFVAARTGRSARELRAEVEAIVPRASAEGPDRGLARITLAYARVSDDAFDDTTDDDEPEIVVNEPRPKRRR
ncbi:MAG: (2Fe-2S)-binding protein [Deltaproteobacteria bacterium]|nr:(2Fe-2S)-binding protein [Deltaproteobacteria bacterium]